MGRNFGDRATQHQALLDIEAIVSTRIRKDIRLAINCYFGSDKPGDETRGYVSFAEAGGIGSIPKERWRNEPGIPLPSLVPEKIGPIAYWVIKQMKEVHPEWFIKDKQ
jgi:hypothetical protein